MTYWKDRFPVIYGALGGGSGNPSVQSANHQLLILEKFGQEIIQINT